VPPRRPIRGEIWWVDFDPVVGSEQAGKRPALIISADRFHQIQNRLVMVVPITITQRPYPFHIEVEAGTTTLREPIFVMCDQPRMISTQRLLDDGPVGRISAQTIGEVEDRLRVILGLF
jgi:mRNA interferase MazF